MAERSREMRNLINEKKSVHEWIDLMLTIPNQQKEVSWCECIDLIPREEEIDWTKVPYGALVELDGSVLIEGCALSKESRICKFVGYDTDDGYIVFDVSEYSTQYVYDGFHPSVCKLIEGGK